METKPGNNGLDPRLHSPAKQGPGRTARPLQIWRVPPRRSLQVQVAVAVQGLTRTANAVTDSVQVFRLEAGVLPSARPAVPGQRSARPEVQPRGRALRAL